MKSQDIRQSFLDFFSERGHRVVASSPLVPHGDPTLLFTNAGMVQFKDYFVGREEPPYSRAVSVQKCLRVSGKHNDLENVGPSPRHHTFFEMLGNFSFGDYFKEEAIRAGWELVTNVWGLDPAVLSATVFEEDDEAEALWRGIAGLPAERVHRCGAADNFWAMGDTGPCGPCSEIFVDRHPDRPSVDWEEGTESGRYLEIWNLVFMQFERRADGSMTPLPDPSIDTGAGLERVAAVLQGFDSNYDTDLFQPILAAAAEIAGKRYGEDDRDDVALRVIADHLRAVTFLLADGVIPGNEGRGYVLRRILRRATRHGMHLGFEEPFLHRLVPVLEEVMGGAYPELAATRQANQATVRAEEEKFLSTVASGARQVQEAVEEAREAGRSRLDGETVFKLYDTHGLPLEVIREIAEEERTGIDEEGFEQALEAQRRRSREATGDEQKRMAAVQELMRTSEALERTEFRGYDRTTLEEALVCRVIRDADAGPEIAPGLGVGESGRVLLDRTAFYAEGGGQVGDTGHLLWPGGRARVLDTQKDAVGNVYHQVRIEVGALELGARVSMEVDAERRGDTERNHTATHLLHAALREELGDTVRQKGSLVHPDRLRFDFSFSRPLEEEELRRIETRVNEWVRRAVDVEIRLRPYREAVADGAMALFGEKYGDEVRTVAVPGTSLELCGGCHVANTGAIGLLLITAEKGVASGVRRVEAVTGRGALDRVRDREELLQTAAQAAGVPPERIPEEMERVRGELEERERELARLRRELVKGSSSEEAPPEDVDGVKVLAREVPSAPSQELREMADMLRQRLGSGVVVIGSREEEKVSLVAAVTDDLAGRVHAGNLVRSLAAKVGGGGGGRPDFAQAGGREPEKLEAALASASDEVRRQLGR
jgi:alanyl-tRNA synthetase